MKKQEPTPTSDDDTSFTKQGAFMGFVAYLAVGLILFVALA